MTSEEVRQAMEQAIAEEREACAKIAESYDKGDGLQRGSDGWQIAADIRARGASLLPASA